MTLPRTSSSLKQVMVYQGTEPLNPGVFALTFATSLENGVGDFESDMRIAPEISSYLSAAMELAFFQPLPRIFTRALLAFLRTAVSKAA